jgi:hypothetical protein
MIQQPNVRAVPIERPAAQRDRVAVAAAGIVEADSAELASLQGNDRNLRHADEQTILALAAVRRASESVSLSPFDNWGTIVAPRWQGRSGTTAFIERFHAVGVRGVGPHAIPNLSMHAAAATISLCLGARGPVYGAGGGPAHVSDGLLAGLTAQLALDSDGTWLALTEWDGSFGRAVAVALVSDGISAAPLKLAHRAAAMKSNWSPASLAGLADFLANPTGRRWDCPLDGGNELFLSSEQTP